ncbi:hypothetical protein DFP94_1011130 [Fontibacillus phaseoli]|uniref:Uncharacterized protein n=1 Tax=Fontibacillus phaseoli TaxID=1416533 RepID=A0A369BQ65_9BACL|nr:hypothetical protein [Fontibacillus phaseoli]RCX23531.1 hypothetical protein DFP94_1011130 [Fontibacillus phaseoli]
MENWLFTGKSDKRDLLLYICKVLSGSGNRVLLVDMTDGKKYRYLIGEMKASLPITEFCGFDICDNVSIAEAGHYDYCLYDLETLQFGSRELWEGADAVLWVTSYDRYEVESSAEWFAHLFLRWPQLKDLEIKPVFIRTFDGFLNADYIMGFVEHLPVYWSGQAVQIPWSETNAIVQMENEHAQSLRMRGISRAYKKALMSLIVDLAGWSGSLTKKALRMAERKRA